MPYRPFLFELKKSKDKTYFFKIQSVEGAGEFDISLVSYSYFTKLETNSNLYFGLFFGLFGHDSL